MPLTANFLADFSSFLGEADKGIAKTAEMEAAAKKLGPAFDQFMKEASKAAEDEAKLIEKARADALKLGEDIGKGLLDLGKKTTAFVQGYLRDFEESQKSTDKLTNALREQGILTDELVKSYAEMAKELQKTSTFSDEMLTDAQAMLTALGKIGPEKMRETLTATMELAKGMSITLPAAAKLVAEAARTNGEELGKMRDRLKENLQPGADFNAVLDAIFKTFGGANAQAVGSVAGQMEQLKNQMNDINVLVGKVFAENLQTILGFFQSLPEWIQTTVLAVAGIGAVVAPVLVSLSSLVSLLSGPAAAAMGAAFTASLGIIFDALSVLLAWLGPAGWIALAVIGLVTALWTFWDEIVAGVKWLVKTVGGLFDEIVTWVAKTYQGIAYWLRDRLGALIEYAATLPAKIVNAFMWAYDQLVGFSIVPDLVNGISAQFGRLDRVMVDPAWDAAAEAAAAFESIGDAALPTLTAGAAAAGLGGGAAGAPVVNITMNGMMGTDDPQTRAMLRDLVSSALMDAMRGTRLMGTA